MRCAPKSRSKAPVLSMTSMLDVIFLLLFYFAARSVKSQWEADLKVTLPQAKSAEARDDLYGELKLNVHKDGTLIVNDVQWSYEKLAQRLTHMARVYPEQTVFVRADKEASYETITRVIDTCRGAGVYNFSLATLGAPDEEPKAERAP